MEYWIVPITATYTGDKTGNPTFGITVKFVGSDNRTYNGGCGVLPNPVSDVGELYKGGVAKRNTCVAVPAGANGLWTVNGGLSARDRSRRSRRHSCCRAARLLHRPGWSQGTHSADPGPQRIRRPYHGRRAAGGAWGRHGGTAPPSRGESTLVLCRGSTSPRPTAFHNPRHINVIPFGRRASRALSGVMPLMVQPQHGSTLAAKRNHRVVVEIPPSICAVLLAFDYPGNGVQDDQSRLVFFRGQCESASACGRVQRRQVRKREVVQRVPGELVGWLAGGVTSLCSPR
jgi:hypothetical protein